MAPSEPEGELEPPAETVPRGRRRVRRRYIALAVLVVGLVAATPLGLRQLRYARTHPSTDDAVVDGDIYPVSPRINSRVARVLVAENQAVRAGQLLVELDAEDLHKQLLEAQASVQTEQASERAALAGVGISQTTTAASSGQAGAGLQAARAQHQSAVDQVAAGSADYASALAARDAAAATSADSANAIKSAQAGVDGALASQASADAGVGAAREAVRGAEAAVRGADDGVGVAQAQVAAALATAKRAQADAKRAAGLFAAQAISQSQLDAAEADSATAEAHVAGARHSEAAAQAALDGARANLLAAQSNLSQALAKQQGAGAIVGQARAAYDSALRNSQVSAAKARQAAATAKKALSSLAELRAGVSQRRAGVAQARASVQAAGAGPIQVEQSRAQAGVAGARMKQALARADELLLQITYARILAPHDGAVSQKNVNLGQAVQQGQPLMAVVDLAEVHVTASFKETDLTHVQVGDPATFTVDAYPGIVFRGHVASLSAGTGAVFALLPPQNATGNFTKVVQRVPVRIAVDTPPDPAHPLRLGMSVVVTVSTR